MEQQNIKPSRKKLIYRSIFMFIFMGVPMQLLVNLWPGASIFPTSLVLPLVGMIGGMSANYVWEYLWFKITGRVEI